MIDKGTITKHLPISNKVESLSINKLDKSGGVMTGNLAPSSIYANKDNSELGFLGIGVGSNYNAGGSALLLYGAGRTDVLKGVTGLRANNGTDVINLYCYPNGDLLWGGKQVDRVETSGTNYIRYASGVQICWGAGQYDYNQAITFPVSFSAIPSIPTTSNAFQANNWGRTGFTIGRIIGNAETKNYLSWVAIGKWK